MTDTAGTRAGQTGGGAPRDLTPAAQRALAEAEERRRLQADALQGNERPAEINGRGGKEPVRFGDWEVKGLAVDF